MTRTFSISRTLSTAMFGIVALASLVMVFAPSASLYAG